MQERDEHTWMRLIGNSDDVLGEAESGGASPAAGGEDREVGKYGRAPLHGYAEEQEASDALAAAEVLASFGTIAGVQAVTNSSFQPPFPPSTSFATLQRTVTLPKHFAGDGRTGCWQQQTKKAQTRRRTHRGFREKGKGAPGCLAQKYKY